MAATVAAVAYGNYKVKPENVGSLRQTQRSITFDSYTTSGEPITAAQFGMKRIVKVANVVLRAGFAAGYAHVDPLIQTDGSMLVRLRAAAGTESASGAGSAAVVAHVTVAGY